MPYRLYAKQKKDPGWPKLNDILSLRKKNYETVLECFFGPDTGLFRRSLPFYLVLYRLANIISIKRSVLGRRHDLPQDIPRLCKSHHRVRRYYSSKSNPTFPVNINASNHTTSSLKQFNSIVKISLSYTSVDHCL